MRISIDFILSYVFFPNNQFSRYYNQLYFVERRFFPPDRSLGIFFEWYDSLTGKYSPVVYIFFHI